MHWNCSYNVLGGWTVGVICSGAYIGFAAPLSTDGQGLMDKTADRDEARGATSPDGGNDMRNLPVIDEALHVDKVNLDRGGYRITKHVETREEVVDEMLRNQRVEIERRQIGKQLETGQVPEPRYEGETLVIPVVEEVLVTEKRLLLVEEVRVTRIQGTHRDPQRVILRKEDIEIARVAADPSSARNP